MRSAAITFVLFVFAAVAGPAWAESLPSMTVWKSPWCGCCSAWVAHMQANGFTVDARDIEDLDTIKEIAGVAAPYRSCHTARIDGYVIEGHVPAADVKRLLAERPKALGLAVPGMPSGSPGMENGRRDAYDVLLLGRDGSAERYASYR